MTRAAVLRKLAFKNMIIDCLALLAERRTPSFESEKALRYFQLRYWLSTPIDERESWERAENLFCIQALDHAVSQKGQSGFAGLIQLLESSRDYSSLFDILIRNSRAMTSKTVVELGRDTIEEEFALKILESVRIFSKCLIDQSQKYGSVQENKVYDLYEKARIKGRTYGRTKMQVLEERLRWKSKAPYIYADMISDTGFVNTNSLKIYSIAEAEKADLTKRVKRYCDCLIDLLPKFGKDDEMNALARLVSLKI